MLHTQVPRPPRYMSCFTHKYPGLQGTCHASHTSTQASKVHVMLHTQVPRPPRYMTCFTHKYPGLQGTCRSFPRLYQHLPSLAGHLGLQGTCHASHTSTQASKVHVMLHTQVPRPPRYMSCFTHKYPGLQGTCHASHTSTQASKVHVMLHTQVPRPPRYMSCFTHKYPGLQGTCHASHTSTQAMLHVYMILRFIHSNQ